MEQRVCFLYQVPRLPARPGHGDHHHEGGDQAGRGDQGLLHAVPRRGPRPRPGTTSLQFSV